MTNEGLLDQNTVLRSFSDSEKARVASLAIRKSYAKEETVFYEGEHWNTVILVLQGSMRSYLNAPSGRNFVVYTWKRGDLFWPHSVFDSEPMPSTMVATEGLVTLQWHGQQLYELVLRNRDVVKALFELLAMQIRKRRQSIYDLAFSPVEHRLAGLINDLFRGAEARTLQRELTLDDMAEMVATSPEVVCRLLYSFQSKGIITINRATITLNDQNALQKLAEED